MTKSSSHFTDLMITKDTSGNADFIFGVDMNRLMTDNSAYSALIADMTDVAKRQIAANSEIMSFNITRRQVKRELSLNTLGSPSIPEVFTNETISHQILGSISEMKEVPLSVSGQPSGIKYLTASDIGLSKQTAGTYQYELSISLVDGFIPTINKLLKKLYRTSNDVTDYLALLSKPENYDSKRRKAKISIREAKTDEMSRTYVDALSYFQNLKNINTEYKRASSLIASRGATKESIGTFQKRLNTITSKVEGLISKTDAGVSPSSIANNPSNSELPNTPTVEVKQSFSSTVSVEHKDGRFVDYFKGKGEVGGGLNTYSNTEVKSSKPEVTYLRAPMTSIEMLEARGVSLSVMPSSVSNACEIKNEQAIRAEKFIGSSALSTGGLLKNNLSPIDLSTVSIGNLVSADDINVAVLSMTPKLSSGNLLQTPVNNVTKVMPKKITSDSEMGNSMSQTLVLVASQDSDTETCSVGGAMPMLKSLEWKPIEEVNTKKDSFVLCRQDGVEEEVVNRFFIMETR